METIFGEWSNWLIAFANNRHFRMEGRSLHLHLHYSPNNTKTAFPIACELGICMRTTRTRRRNEGLGICMPTRTRRKEGLGICMRTRTRRWAIAWKTWPRVPLPAVQTHPPMDSSPSPLPTPALAAPSLPMTMTTNTTSSVILMILSTLLKPKMLLPKPSNVGEYASLLSHFIAISTIKLIFTFFQQAAFVLNASRRFRYTLDLKKEEEKEQKKSMIRAHAQVIRVIFYYHNFFLC